MKILDLYRDYGVDFVTEGHKHTQEGWVNISCPFCGSLPGSNPGYHLGYNTVEDRFHCWRCGGHNTQKTISELLNISYHNAGKVLTRYQGFEKRIPRPEKIGAPFIYPTNTNTMTHIHRRYLEKRNFDPDYLEVEYGLLGTGPMSVLDETYYKNRILAPFYWNEEIVTFQTRDITNKSEFKYLACPQTREIIHHKHIVYGRQDRWRRKGLAVEGITDVWALGSKAFALLGIKYKAKQVSRIAEAFDEVAVCFDPEPQAKKQAKKLVAQLKLAGVKAWRIPLTQDPAEMSEADRRYLQKQI